MGVVVQLLSRISSYACIPMLVINHVVDGLVNVVVTPMAEVIFVDRMYER